MKLKYLFSVAMAGFLFGACSSDDVVVGDGGQDGAVAVQPGEEGFLSMSISLPTTVAGVRAAGYDDGTPDEYQVNNAKLLLFYGAEEAAAKLHRVYDLEVSAFTKNDETQITSSANIVQEILVPPTEEGLKVPNYYAMVVLNDNGCCLMKAMRPARNSTRRLSRRSVNWLRRYRRAVCGLTSTSPASS